MNDLLFLAHRIPFPPNKGDKIRSFHFLQHLSTRFRVHLGAFIDDPADERYREQVAGYCASVELITINPTIRKLTSLIGLLRGEALGLPYYRHPRLAQWVSNVLQTYKPHGALVFSSTMAQYLLGAGASTVPTVVDFVDVDSEKWRAYAKAKRWPLSLLYSREARYLHEYECMIAKHAAASVFVSADEARLFNSLLSAPLSNVCHVDNGVDHEYFKPNEEFLDPYPKRTPILVFTGAMDYWANVDAVTWFGQDILPRVRSNIPDAQFWIVGARPSAKVRALARAHEIVVTGAVDDVRPYLQYAHLVVAPLRIARGVQNKVLEGMAMGKPVIGTHAALEGIATDSMPGLICVSEPSEFASACVRALQVPSEAAPEARAFVTSAYDWQRNLQNLDRLLAA